MPEFSYKARSDRGDAAQGVVDARSEREAIAQLRNQGYTVTDISVVTQLVDSEAVLNDQAARRVKRDDVVAFANQLAVMIDTGVPLADAISAYTEQSRGGPLSRIARLLADRIAAGVQFSSALSEHPRVFPRLMVSLVRASEASGTMGAMLERVAQYLGNEQRTKRKVKGALTYPLIMLTMGGAVTGFLIAWVLPRFAGIYEGRDATLPGPTRFLLGLSEAVTTNWALLLVAAAAIVAGGVALKVTAFGARTVDAVLLGSPVVGPIFRNFHLTRVARTLATLLAAGIQLKEALEIVKGLTASDQWQRLIQEMGDTIDAGRPVSDAVLATSLIPSSFAHMIAAGERTGQLERALERVADVSEEQFDDSVSTGTQLIEPMMIIVMGGVIGGVAVALLLPIFTMGKTMSGG